MAGANGENQEKQPTWREKETFKYLNKTLDYTINAYLISLILLFALALGVFYINDLSNAKAIVLSVIVICWCVIVAALYNLLVRKEETLR